MIKLMNLLENFLFVAMAILFISLAIGPSYGEADEVSGYCSDSPTGNKSAMPAATRALMWFHAHQCEAHYTDDESYQECLEGVYNGDYGVPVWCIPAYEKERKKG